jgi:putative SOS response-associated peptidase YedK
MIITEPNESVAAVHDRMPVLLTEKDYEPWLSGKAGLDLLKPAARSCGTEYVVSARNPIIPCRSGLPLLLLTRR